MICQMLFRINRSIFIKQIIKNKKPDRVWSFKQSRYIKLQEEASMWLNIISKSVIKWLIR